MIDPETRQYLAAAFDPSQSAESRIARLREMSAMPATAPDMAAPPGLTDPSRGAVAFAPLLQRAAPETFQRLDTPMQMTDAQAGAMTPATLPAEIAPANVARAIEEDALAARSGPAAVEQQRRDAAMMTGEVLPEDRKPEAGAAPTDADISQAIADAPEPGTQEPVENVYDVLDVDLTGRAMGGGAVRSAPPQEVIGVNAKLSPVDPGLTQQYRTAEEKAAHAERNRLKLKETADVEVANKERELMARAQQFDQDQIDRRDAMHAEIQRLHAGARKIEDDIAAMPPIGRDRAYAKKGGGGGGFFSLFGRAILGAAVGPEGLDKMSEMAMRKAEHEVALQKAEIANRREQADRAGNMIQRLMATGASMDAAAEKARSIILAQAARDLEEYASVVRAPEKRAEVDKQRAKILADSTAAAANFEAKTGDEIGLSFAQAGRPGTASAMLQEREAARRPAPEPVIEDDLGDLPGPDEGGDIAKIRKLAGMSDTDARVMDAIGTPTGGESVTDEDIMRAIAEAPEPGARQAVSAGVARRQSPVTQAPTFVSDTPERELPPEDQDAPQARIARLVAEYGGDVKAIKKVRDAVMKDYKFTRGGQALALMAGDFRYVSQKQRESVVRLPNGQRAFAESPKRATSLQAGLDAAALLQSNYRRLLKLAETPGHSIDPQMLAEIKLQSADNVLLLKEQKGLGILTESDMDLIAPMTGAELSKTFKLDGGTIANLKVALKKLNKANNAAGMNLTRDPLGRVPWKTGASTLRKD